MEAITTSVRQMMDLRRVTRLTGVDESRLLKRRRSQLQVDTSLTRIKDKIKAKTGTTVVAATETSRTAATNSAETISVAVAAVVEILGKWPVAVVVAVRTKIPIVDHTIVIKLDWRFR